METATALTNDSALVAVDGSPGARDVLLDDIQGKDDGGVDPEGDLPGQQGGEERGRRERDARVAAEKAAHVVTEGFGRVRRRREGEEVGQIGGDPPPGSLGRPLVHNHGRSEKLACWYSCQIFISIYVFGVLNFKQETIELN